MSFLGQTSGALGENSIGIVVFDDGENLKFNKSLINPIFVCIRPNLNPTQLRGPSPVAICKFHHSCQTKINQILPNGRCAIGWRCNLFSSVNLSGSNFSGSG